MGLIYKDQQIQFIDVNKELMKKDSIENIYQMYSHKIELYDNKFSYINFADKDNVKISDLYGWTEIFRFAKMPNINTWKSIKVADKEIIISSETLIPCYDINNPYRGFHGEVKYPYILKNPEKLTSEDWLRIHRGKDQNNNDIEFDHPIVNDFIPNNNEYGYDIITKSRFGNVNDVQILLSNNVTIEETKSWYSKK